MLKEILAQILITVILGASPLLCQTKTPVAEPQEFPVLLRQNIIAGKTPVGSNVEASLTLATLIGGKVVPEGAIFSGVVLESAAKSNAGPSRLSVRIDSVRWKKGSASVKAYLTAWFYPVELPRDNSSDSQSPVFGPGARAGSSPPSIYPYPSRNPDRLPEPPSAPAPNSSEHRTPLKNVDSVTTPDSGVVVLSSTQSDIKFNKSTTYVLATRDLANSPVPNSPSNTKDQPAKP